MKGDVTGRAASRGSNLKRARLVDGHSRTARAESYEAGRVGRNEIADRAYEIYLARGAAPGHDVDDWLQAERELCLPPLQS